jgi:hypothetical protein
VPFLIVRSVAAITFAVNNLLGLELIVRVFFFVLLAA